jgi:SAM-dependent methyltransferase
MKDSSPGQNALKEVMKRLTPLPVRRLITQWRTDRLQRQYGSLSISDTFTRIYDSGAWSGGDRSFPNSGLGSTGRYVEEYRGLLHTLLAAKGMESVADLGCGNFNTGKTIAPMVRLYTGVDIAQRVLDVNTQLYSTERIRFTRADLTCDPLPVADIAIVRQVLQHLTNSEVRAALDNVLATYPQAIITEHIYIGGDAKPNLDIPHGPGTRVPMKSGVFIDQPPFSVKGIVAGDIAYAPNEVLRTWVADGMGKRP